MWHLVVRLGDLLSIKKLRLLANWYKIKSVTEIWQVHLGCEPGLRTLMLGYMKIADRLTHLYVRLSHSLCWNICLFARFKCILSELLVITLNYLLDRSLAGWKLLMNRVILNTRFISYHRHWKVKFLPEKKALPCAVTEVWSSFLERCGRVTPFEIRKLQHGITQTT